MNLYFKEQVKPVRKLRDELSLLMSLTDKMHTRWFADLDEEKQLLLIDIAFYLENRYQLSQRLSKTQKPTQRKGER